MNKKSEKPERLEDILASLPADDPERRLLEALFADESFSHEEAQAMLPDYVTDELLGLPVRERYPRLHRHLLHCPICADMYANMIRDLTEEVPIPAVMPQPDLSFLPVPVSSRLNALLGDVRSTTRQALEAIVAAGWPQFQDEVGMVLRVFFRQIDQFGDDFILQPHAARAMGFGPGEAHLSQRMALAIHKTLMALKKTYEGREEVDAERLMAEAKAAMEDAAQDAGLSGKEKARFVEAYLDWFAKEMGVS